MENTAFTTPMMQQYRQIKERHPDCLLLFRLGDFYEMFMEDAKIGAEVLGITLTARPRGKDGDIPMAGVPFHAVDSYLNKLVESGLSVAICEQLSDPKEPGIVERDVVRIVTPGTLINDSKLNQKESNFVLSINIGNTSLGVAYADLSTGEISAFETTFEDVLETKRPLFALEKILSTELTKISPKEIVLPTEYYDNQEILWVIKKALNTSITKHGDMPKNLANVKKRLTTHFGVNSLESFGLAEKNEATRATYTLIEYLGYTQKDKIAHLRKVRTHKKSEFLELDKSTIFNLELVQTLRTGEKEGSLLYHLDKTKTAMGGRKIKKWILAPLMKKEDIESRLNQVEHFFDQRGERLTLTELLTGLSDIERVLAKISVGLGNPRDLINLAVALQNTDKIIAYIKKLQVNIPLLSTYDSKAKEIAGKIVEVIKIDPPIDPKQGGFINTQVDAQLDDLRKKVGKSKEWIAELEEQERLKTDIQSLKVRFNKVFGFYIEISKSNLKNVPANYMRKQTLVNAERFITPELKAQEEIILTAEEKINTMEYEIFKGLVDEIIGQSEPILAAANIISDVDCITCLADIAEIENYVKPIIYKSDKKKSNLKILGGRHPVVEKTLRDTPFVPNDIDIDSNKVQLIILTGPNMAGKSVFIRQVAVITLMAQMGSFVPADHAEIAIADKIYVRSGASDMISLGLSTFMVEMVETANILNNATNDSLIVLDEIGRGTSTYDGISIAWAVADFLVRNPQKISPKTLFATHYHELAELEKDYPDRVANMQMAVAMDTDATGTDATGDPVFLHKVVPGGAEHSYGIAVARMAGVPQEVISRAEKILKKLEQGERD